MCSCSPLFLLTFTCSTAYLLPLGWITPSNRELLSLLSNLLLLLKDSTSKSFLQFFTQHYTGSGAQMLDNATEAKDELKNQVTQAWARSRRGRTFSRHIRAGCSLLCEPHPPFLTQVPSFLPWCHQGQILCSQFTSPVVYSSIHLKDTFCWLFHRTIVFIFIIIQACVTPMAVNRAIQSLRIRHAIYLSIAVNLTGCIYGAWKMFFCSVLNLLPCKLIMSFCSYLQQLLKRKKQSTWLNTLLWTVHERVDEISAHWGPKDFCQGLHGADVHSLH